MTELNIFVITKKIPYFISSIKYGIAYVIHITMKGLVWLVYLQPILLLGRKKKKRKKIFLFLA